jgi:hypothetical protein
MADSNAEKGQAQSTVFSNLKSGLPGVVKDRLISIDSTEKGHHMGCNQLSKKPKTDYQPTPGLVRHFSKTGTTQEKPKHTYTPPNEPPPLLLQQTRCSYADVVHRGMEGNGAQAHRNGNGNGYRGHHPTDGFRSQADAAARRGFQRPYPRRGGGGYTGGRGGGRY